MCGIAGDVGQTLAESALQGQLLRLTHRGPDSSGVFALPGIGAVGQTRLAVIDLQHGNPPLADESGSIGAVLNGEIYNFREIRDELMRDGHQLTSRGDTEVIAHLAESLDPVALCQRLDGMFAFAVLDGRRRRLVLGRDRLGKKPLYYWSHGGRLVFGSEIKAVLAAPGVPREFDASCLPAYLHNGYVPPPGTAFAGVKVLAPGCVLTFEAGGEPKIERYWSLDDVPSRAPETEDEAVAGIRRLLVRAVEKRLIADVPLGAFLSGGLDSSAVVAIMTQLMSEPVRTFSIGFDSARFDESAEAERVARHLGSRHTTLRVDHTDVVGLLEEVLDACDQPFADSSALPTNLLAKLTRQHVTVAMSGDGGDEVFAGYDRFLAARALGRVPLAVRTGIRPWAGASRRLEARARGTALGTPVRVLAQADRSTHVAYDNWLAVVKPAQRRALLAGEPAAAAPVGDVLHDLLRHNLTTYLPEDLLVKVDRMSMAHGLEVRSPLLDIDLLTYSLGLPASQHVRGRRGKVLLRRAVSDLLPPEVLTRGKKGFGVPIGEWLRGDLAGWMQDRLASGGPMDDHIDTTAVSGLVGAHLARQRDYGAELWALLVLEAFLRREAVHRDRDKEPAL